MSAYVVFFSEGELPFGGPGLRSVGVFLHMCQGLNSHYFHIVGDGHQPNSRGLYTHYKDSY